MENKYHKAKIYKIVDNKYTKCYIGSTCQDLSKRIAEHRRNFRCKQHHNVSVYQLFREFGIENCKIELIEHFPSNSKEELAKREGEIIRTTECVNKRVEGRTRKEYYQDNCEKILENNRYYQQDHRQEIHEQQNQHYKENRDKVLEERKRFYQANLTKILDRAKKYRQNNRDQLNEKCRQYYHKNKSTIQKQCRVKIACECGCQIRRSDIAKHRKTNKHNELMQIKTTEITH